MDFFVTSEQFTSIYAGLHVQLIMTWVCQQESVVRFLWTTGQPWKAGIQQQPSAQTRRCIHFNSDNAEVIHGDQLGALAGLVSND